MQEYKEYELTLLIQPQLDEESRDALIESVADTLTHGEGEEAKPTINKWGVRNLAYPILKHNEAFYVLYEAKMDGTKIREIEREFTYNDDILRYLFIRKAVEKNSE